MIESVSNPKVKEVIKLQNNKKHRHTAGRFVVEGWRMISEVPNWYFDRLFVTQSCYEKCKAMFQGGFNALQVELVSDKVLEAMSLETTSQGILATVVIPKHNDVTHNTKNPLIIALEDIQDPGNLGTILRTADAAGVDQVVLSSGTVDLYNPKVIKATMGAIFRLSITTGVDLSAYVDSVVAAGYKVYAAHLKGTMNHFEADYKGGTCFLMGNEGNGLSEMISKKATDLIKIPMQAGAESLNVAMASGILMYEAVRQRY